MKTYVNTSLIDAHNAQMQLEQIEGVRFQRAGTMEVYGKFLLICAAGLALLMIGFGIMIWLMTPEPAPVADEYSTNYDISDVVIHNAVPGETRGKLTDSAGEAAELSSTGYIPGVPSISESLVQIQSSLSEASNNEKSADDHINLAVADEVAAARSASSAEDSIQSRSELSTGEVESSDSSTTNQAQSLPGDEFVVFRSHHLEGGVGRVITGLKYRPDDLDKPYGQYCYWTEAPGPSGRQTFDLGDVEFDSGPVWSDNEMTERYKQYCRFLGA